MKILLFMQALWLFRVAVKEGHFSQQQWEEGSPPPPRLEINLHAMTAGVAMLSLYSWLTGLRAHLAKAPGSSLPARLAVVTDKGKSSKEQGNLVVKEAVAAIMNLWEAPFRCCTLWCTPLVPGQSRRDIQCPAHVSERGHRWPLLLSSSPCRYREGQASRGSSWLAQRD